jgi:hypothetical protein
MVDAEQMRFPARSGGVLALSSKLIMPNLPIHKGQDWLELSIVMARHREVLAWNIFYLHRRVLTLKQIGDQGNLGVASGRRACEAFQTSSERVLLMGIFGQLLREPSYIR